MGFDTMVPSKKHAPPSRTQLLRYGTSVSPEPSIFESHIPSLEPSECPVSKADKSRYLLLRCPPQGFENPTHSRTSTQTPFSSSVRAREAHSRAMAHIFDLAGQIDVPSYTDGQKTGTQVRFPATPVFSGFNQPSRIEGDIFDLEFTGQIPPAIDGTFYRIQPDHRFPPLFADDIHFNGDGAVTAIRISQGHADMRHRYVHTARYTHETAARRSLFGRYRNPFTDHESVRGVIRTASNTNVTFHRGVLLASKEDGPPYALDPTTLATLGRYDFEGQIRTPTFTAHPKFDPRTGEMVCFAYEAGGDGNDASDDVVVWTIDRDGRKIEECWYKAPFCGMIHDCGISENYVVLPLTPIKADAERLRKGGNHFAVSFVSSPSFSLSLSLFHYR